MIGSKVGRWLITEEIGDGGHAFVFRGEDAGEVSAVKMLKPSVAAEDSLDKRFVTEAEVLRQLNHPAIVGFRDYIHKNGYHYLVLEYMDGGSIDEILDTQGPIEPRYALPLFCRVAEGVIHAHEFGYIHRDLKPNNILLNRAGEAKVTDFGIAKVVGGENLTRKGFVVGTTAYMAPEYLSQGVVSPQTDVYGLGVTLYEMLTNRQPFEHDAEKESVVAFVKRVCLTDPAVPSTYRPVPKTLERIVMKALHRDPKKRYKTVARLLQDIRTNFPELADRPVEMPEGRELRTSTFAMPEVEHTRGRDAARRTDAFRRAMSQAWIAAAVGAGIVAGLIGLFLAGAMIGILAGVVGVLAVLAAGWVTGSQRRARTRALASRTDAAHTIEASVPVAQSEPEEDSVPFHAGRRQREMSQTNLSELSAFVVVVAGESLDTRFGLRPVSRIGRDLRFDIRPRDVEISRQHAAITFDGSGFVVRDIGSTNGTFVNEERVGGERRLHDGDIVRVGRTSMRFEYGEREAEAASGA